MNKKLAGIIAVVIILLVAIVFGVFFYIKKGKQTVKSEIQQTTNSVEINATPVEKIEPKIDLFKVVKIIDGDTIDVDIEGKIETIRLIGIDAPETVDLKKETECFSEESTNKATELLEGEMVRLEPDDTQGERDQYGRLLRFVSLEDGTSFNKYMIFEGYAREYTYQISNPYKYQGEYQETERQAKESKKGIWGDACVKKVAQPVVKKSITATVAQVDVLAVSKKVSNLPNQFKVVVSGILSRSGVPDSKEFEALRKIGIRSMINLLPDSEAEGRGKVGSNGFIYLHLAIAESYPPSIKDANTFLSFVKNPANWPVHVYCKAGNARTGTMVALYRYSAQGWTMEKAISESKKFGGGLSKKQITWLKEWARMYPH